MEWSTAPVLVAVDGSEHAGTAVRWAAAEAGRRQTWLRVVTVYPWPVGHRRNVVGGGDLRKALQETAEETAGKAVAVAEAAGVQVRADVVGGEAATVLVAEAASAQVLVLGSRGLGGFGGLMLGSTAIKASASAPCPVVVVHPAAEEPAPRVVVGVEGGEGDAAALEYAFAHAERTGATVVPVHAWGDPLLSSTLAAGHSAVDPGGISDSAAVVLDEALAAPRAAHPKVDVEPVVDRGTPAEALLRAGDHASLVVVGSRGLGNLAGLVMGSVSQHVLRHAGCPVAVVRPQA